LATIVTRPEPACVFVTGPPGVGKSALISILMSGLAYKDGENYDPAQTYNYNPDDNFHSSYKQGIKYTVFDDCFKHADADKRSAEASELIHMVNTVPYILSTPFDDKGKVTFESSYVFVTTNVANHGIDKWRPVIGMTDPDAIKRRFHVVLHRTDPICPDVKDNTYRLDKVNLPGYEVGQILNVKQIIELTHAVRQANIKNQQTHNYDNKFFEDMFSESPEPEEAPNGDFDAQADNQDEEQDFIIKLVSLGIVDWYDSPNRNYYIGLFFLLVTMGVATYYCDFFFPEDDGDDDDLDFLPDSQNQKFSHGRSNRKNAKAKIRAIRASKKITKVTRSNQASKRYARSKAAHQVKSSNWTKQSAELNYSQSLISSVSKCTVWACARGIDEDGLVAQSCAIGYHLRDNIVVVPGHYFLPLEHLDDLSMGFKYNGTNHVVDPDILFDSAHFVESIDLVFITLPKDCPTPPAGMKYVWKESDIVEIYNGSPMTMLTATKCGVPFTKNLNKFSDDGVVSYTVGSEPMVIEVPIGYSGDTTKGDSGAPVAVMGSNGKAIVVGLHLGKQRNVGIAMQITQESLNEFINAVDCFGTQSSSDTFPLKYERVDCQPTPHPLTKLRRAPLYDWARDLDLDGQPFGECLKIPARLRPHTVGDTTVNPMYNAISHFKQVKFDAIPISEQTKSWWRNLYPRIDNPRNLTDDEMYNGSPELNYNCVNYSTSPGYPFNKRGGPGKSAWIIKDEVTGRMTPTQDLTDAVSLLEDSFLRGEDREVLFLDCLKDETRPRGKGARTIGAGPIDYTLLGRKYLGHMISYVQDKCATHPISVGINPHSLEWTMLANKATAFNGSVVSGDFSKFDRNVPTSVSEVAADLINEWYNDGPVNATARKLILSKSYEATHICEGKVYKTVDTTASGEPATAFNNSVKNCLMLHTVLTVGLKLTNTQFWFFCYGDDFILFTDIPDLRVSDLVPHFKEMFGMTLTHFSKQEVDPIDSISTVSYLGRRFVLMQGVYKAPLSMHTIIEMMYWMRGKDRKIDIFLSTLQCFYLELSHYDKDTFEYWTRAIADCVKSHKDSDISSLHSAVVKARHDWWYYHRGMYTREYAVDFSDITLYYGSK